MEEAINGIKNLIETQVKAGKIYLFGKSFDIYQRVYATTNENIEGYLSQINLNGKKSALTVLASGDHLFNLISYGILDIDTFDCNQLTEYYALGIKKAAILALSYEEYLDFINFKIPNGLNFAELVYFMEKIIPYMEEKYQIFWGKILEYNYKIQKENHTNLDFFKMLLLNCTSMKGLTIQNAYLLNEQSYNSTKENLKKAKITFKYAYASQLPLEFTKHYDIVLLSNILDYFYRVWGFMWEYSNLKKYEQELFNIMNHDGILALSYLFQYRKTNDFIRKYTIKESKVLTKDLQGEDILFFPHIDTAGSSDLVEDALILKRY